MSICAVLRLAVVASVLCPGLATAGLDFGRTAPLDAVYAATDGTASDLDPELATDGQGVWIAAWSGFPGGTLGITGNGAPVFSRSLDDGVTWSPTSLVRPETNTNLDAIPSLATDTHGKWMLVWGANSIELRVTTSVDNGQNWIGSSVLSPPGSDSFNFDANIDTDRMGTWVVAWTSADTLGGTIGTDYDVLFVRSTDDGVSWSSPAPLNTNAGLDSPGSRDSDVQIATDRAGIWLAVWSTFAQTWFARSIDNGATWGTPVALSHVGWQGNTSPSVATDGAGHWVAAWTNSDSAPSSPSLAAPHVWVSHSWDNGATWAAESKLHSHVDVSGYDAAATVASLGGGLWNIVWSSGEDPKEGTGKDTDLRVSTSRDEGLSWSSPAAPTVRSRFDGDEHDFEPAVESSPTGMTMAVWRSQDSLGGTIGSDYDILFARAIRNCASTARNDCHAADPEGSSLRIRDKIGGADSLKWRWRSNTAGTDADLGDPTTTDSYVLCLYEKVGGSAGLIGEWDAHAAGTCRGLPCWTKAPGSVAFSDRSLETSSLRSVSISAGAGGSKIALQAKGPALAPPRMPLDVSTPVQIQLVNLGTGVCWDGTYTTSVKNDLENFRTVSE